jgi:hypothetical protein
MKRISDLEDDTDETKKEVAHLRREIGFMQHLHSDKIQGHLSTTVAHLEQRVKRLEKEKHGLAISAGKAKAKVSRLESKAKH